MFVVIHLTRVQTGIMDENDKFFCFFFFFQDITAYMSGSGCMKNMS